MPKASEEYYENKRKEIIDAAFRVCARKPISSVEMKDIIAETGFSHGVIYRYYKDLDEVLKDLVITINENNKIDDRLEAILAKAKPGQWEDTIYKICDMLAGYMTGVGTDLLKICVYSDMMAMTDPQRSMNIASRLGKGEQSPLLYAMVATQEYLTKVIEENNLKPVSSVDEIVQFFVVNYHGILSGYVITECFKAEHVKGKYKPRDMFRNLAKAIVLMMGGKVK